MTDPKSETSPAAQMAAAARFLAGDDPAPTDKKGGASDLTIDGVLLLDSIGWEPVELVTGLSWWSIPTGSWAFGKGEMAVVTTAHQRAIDAAERQLADQCESAGGHGVVGVRLEVHTERHHATVELVGTAVRPIGAGSLGARPFTSDLSARDFVVMTGAGWRPVGLCVGVSFVFAPRRRRAGLVRQVTGNYELENFTTSLYNAREQAMERMQSAAVTLGASGIIGTTITEGPVHFAHHAIGFVSSGTAAHLEPGGHIPHDPVLVIPLDDAANAFEARSLREG